ncbi:MAG: glutamate 5-kinase [Gammaproteobacteria bacterium]|nr:glutamate 5-kinase [Gammaproteobacteria bacterium]
MSEARPGRKLWVVKLGSALLTDGGRGVDTAAIADGVAQVAALRSRGIDVVLVSSGAVAEGMLRLGLGDRPRALHQLQAAAAVGQSRLIQAYESAFSSHDIVTAQVLLTHDDLSNRGRYLNARSTLRTLIDFGVVSIVNENDTVATEEIRFGDNDTLAGLVANLTEASRLVLLTDQPGLLTTDPKVDASATLVAEARANDPALDGMAGDGGRLGRGGMRTKLRAARYAARSGTETIIASGRVPDVLLMLAEGEPVGTRLLPDRPPMLSRKRWLAGGLQPMGEIQIDDGAARVLRQSGSSLLAVGVAAVKGEFARGDLVICSDRSGLEVARGLVNYSAAESRLIMGQSSAEIERVLGYVDEPELIHRDNLVVSQG